MGGSSFTGSGGFREDDEEPSAARPMQGPAAPQWFQRQRDSEAAAVPQTVNPAARARRPQPSGAGLDAVASAVAAARKARKKEKKAKRAKQKLKAAAKEGKASKRKKSKKGD